MDSERDPLDALIALALEEDLGDGDRTTSWTVPEGRAGVARMVAKAPLAISGIEVAARVFRAVDAELAVTAHAADGDRVEAGRVVMEIRGRLASILAAERVALNFIGRLTGVATLTRAFVDRTAGTPARIIDTRKTTPGFRTLEKAAVVHGGGANHRIGLWDMVLIKENHVAGAGGIVEALRAVRDANHEGIPVEIEVRDREEFRLALTERPDRIMLDNMTPETMRRCVEARDSDAPGVELEASGNVSLETVEEIARTGVDFISVGALTHSAPVGDLSLLVEA